MAFTTLFFCCDDVSGVYVGEIVAITNNMRIKNDNYDAQKRIII